jgi:hypothetical protein
MIPGSNLLRMAMGPIARQALTWRAWVSRSANAAGDYVNVFADPVPITGSMQPVKADLYVALGLNLEKNYSFLWTEAAVMPLDRDRPGDVVLYDGKSWQVTGDRNWAPADGWRKLLCVEVPNYE